jgi:TonB family protein
VLVQVVEREVRARRSVPRLGEGLDARQQQRLAQRIRDANPVPAAPLEPAPGSPDFGTAVPPPPPTNTVTAASPTQVEPGVQPVALLEAEQPESPPDVDKGGEVALQVKVGLLGEVTEVRIVQSTDPVFNEAAEEAARRSRYRVQTRNGIPEEATLTITFKFVAPQEN